MAGLCAHERTSVADSVEYDASGTPNLKKRYIYGNPRGGLRHYIDEVLYLYAAAGDEDYYYAHDHLYSLHRMACATTALLNDSGGSVVERYEYDACWTALVTITKRR